MNARTSTVLCDLLFTIVLILILLPHGAETQADDPPLLGDVVMEATWPGDVDVDLWVRGPGYAAVGYSARQSRVASLLLDDLGHIPVDPHREIVVVHTASDGAYVANIHLFRGTAATVQVTLWRRSSGQLEAFWTGTLQLGHRQEATAIRWQMVGREIIPGSERFDFVSVRGERPYSGSTVP